MDKSYKWYEGQGHRIKGQGQIYDFLEKKVFVIMYVLLVGLIPKSLEG